VVRRSKPASRAARYPTRWPFIPLWCAGLAVSAVVLAELAYLVGRHSPPDPNSSFEAMRLALSRPGLAVPVAFGALVLAAWCIRHLTLNWLAWRPGSIQVAGLSHGCDAHEADVEQLTMYFRRRLATLQLQSPTPVPGAAPATDFLDVLDRGGVDSRNVLGTLLRVLRAASPTHAYEVRGVLLRRDERPQYGIAVEVLRQPSEGTMSATLWGETWEDALRQAADEATGAILPQTRRCRAPWGVWRGYVMPPGLLHAYEDAALLERDRRYDEALARYYDALDLDPMNMVLRLRIGQVQERMGLLLDALATYLGMRATSRPAGVRLSRLLYRGRGRRERRRALLSARYRRNVLLGGRVLIDQWRSPEETPPTKRDDRRRELRACLRGHLAAELCKIEDEDTVERILSAPLGADEDDDYFALRELFARYALHDCAELRESLHRHVFDRRVTLTSATVALTEVCIRTRLRSVRSRGERCADWPPTPEQMTAEIADIEIGPSGRVRSFQTWHEHYNAACAYALPLRDIEHLDDGDADRFAKAAVRRLELATARADSAYIASRRDWLLSEDPDLMGLRAHSQFVEFEVMHLPSSSITPRRPTAVRQLESSRYVRDLLVAIANTWQPVWRARKETLNGGVAVEVLLQWFGDELQTWDDVRTVAREYRHSGSRLALIRNLQRCADRYEFTAPTVGFPRYELDPLDRAAPRDECDDAATAAITNANERLASLYGIVGDARQRDPQLMRVGLTQWQDVLRRQGAAARPLSSQLLSLLCDRHAALWQLLAEWLEADEDSAPDAADRFQDNVDETRRLWRVALGLRTSMRESRNGHGSVDAARAAWLYTRIRVADLRDR
jgi:hypothetical protein